MVDKVAKRINSTRKNWYEAFKMSLSIKGYEYYEAPGEIRYRYPAPGSVALDAESYPHLFKKHWKTPFRDSHLNIRHREKQLTVEDNTEHVISNLVEFDAEKEPHLAGMQMPNTDDLHVLGEGHDVASEESLQELWAEFDHHPQTMHELRRDYSPYINEYEHEYN